MLIDWFTVAAQAVNFLVLVWLLQHFLYKPILAAIEARENKIAATVAAAAAQQTEVQKSREELSAKLKAVDDEGAGRLAQAKLEVQKQREQLLDAARREAADLIARQRDALRTDAASIGDRMALLATAEVFSIAVKALNELASADFEERLGSVLTQRLLQLSQEAKGVFRAALEQSAMTAVVGSRVAMRDAERATLSHAVNETFSADVHLEFKTMPTADYGIDLSAGGQRLAWGIAEYISEFQAKAQSLMLQSPSAALATVAASPEPVRAP